MIEIDCAGAPRDLGLDQGLACAEMLRARFGALSRSERLALRLGRPGRSGVRGDRALRAARRHFPHLSESLEGIARGARVPLAWLARELVTGSARGDGGAVASADPAGGGLWLCGAPPEALLRRSRPEGGFRSLELALPWLAAALAGVNEAGLAVVAIGGPHAARGDAAPATLLTQDCLRRLDSLEAALEWCAVRPCGGRATLLLADARGEGAAVERLDGECRVRRCEPGAWLEVGAAAGATKSLDAGPAARERLGAALASRGAGCAALDPARRTLAWIADGEPIRRYAL